MKTKHTPMTKTEGNKLIAKFMGGVMVAHKNNPSDFSKWRIPGRGVVNFLFYETHWDWLMPIVGKVNTILLNLSKDYNKNGLKDALIRFKINDHYKALSNALMEADIDAVWEEVVEVIAWHNERI